jgi:elongation factor G
MPERVAGDDMSNVPPVIEVPIEPTTESERESLTRALAELAAEDDSFRFSADRESGQIIIAGTGELHLDNKLDILKRVYQLKIHIGNPQVAYRETISRPANKAYTYKKQSGGSGQFARLKIACEPLPTGSGVLIDAMAAGTVPKEFIAGIEKGVGSVLSSGVLAGFPVVDLKVRAIEGAYHDIDSSALTFEIAARAALHEALREAGPILLEPVMTVVVRTPSENADAVIRDLNTRRGTIQRLDIGGNAAEIHATVALAALWGYRNNLAALTRGQGTFEMRYSHYAPVPRFGGDEPFPPAVGMRA